MKSTKRESCSSCEGINLKEIIHFGEIPLAGYFPSFDDLPLQDRYDCNVLICDDCGLLQIDTLVNPEILFKDYRYISSIGLSKHFNQVAEYYNSKFNLSDKFVVEIGSNDGVLLKPISKYTKCIGFEPSINISKLAIEKGCDVIVDYFNKSSVIENNLVSKADIVVANNVFAHINNLTDIIEGIKMCLKDDGIFIAEIHYLMELVNKMQYDFIYHEHIFYHSIFGLNNLFSKNNMTLYDFDLIDVHSGSIRIYVKKGASEINDKVKSQIFKEVKKGITSYSGLKSISESITNHISDCREMIDSLKIQGREIIGFGASGRCNVFSNLLNLDTNDVKFIFDESPERSNRFIPYSNIPVVKFQGESTEKTYDVVLIFAWNFSNMIMSKIKAKDYLLMFPSPRLINDSEKIDGTL